MSPENSDIRREIAQLAAQYIADGGLDHGQAKRRAARELLGSTAHRNALPDNDEIDEALREHLALFDPEHPQRVERLRAAARALMQALSAFNPLITGAVWKGIAPEDAAIHMLLFCDNPKEVTYWLLDHRIDFESAVIPHYRSGEDVEAAVFAWRGEHVVAALYDLDELRGALMGPAPPRRGTLDSLIERINASSEPQDDRSP